MKTHVTTLLLSLFVSTISLAQDSTRITKIKANHRQIHTEIIINGTPEQVWSVLIDQDSINTWSNSFIWFAGGIADSNQIILHVKANPDSKVRQVKHRIFVKEGEYFGWNDSKTLGASDNHRFILEDLGNGKTRFIQSDEMIGGMTWMMGGMIMKIGNRLYNAFNMELKQEVERRFP